GPLTSAVTSTWSPPTSRVRLARSGTVTTTLSGGSAARGASPAEAGAAQTAASAAAMKVWNRVRMVAPESISVRGVGAEEDLQAEVQGIGVAVVEMVGPVVVVLQAQA